MRRLLLLPVMLAFPLSGCSTSDEAPTELSGLQLPDGFRIEVFSDQVPDARSLALSPNGTLFVGTRREGKVYALRDTNGDFAADEVYTLAEDLQMPNGVAFRDGSLFVAEVSRILRFDGIESRLADPPVPTVIADDFPTEAHHGWKYIAFGPDDKLYVPVGAPCNICNEGDPFAAIHRINPDGSDREVVARGVRNTVGFDWHPSTGEMWFTDNGRDFLGDDLPPCELNRLTEVGQHFGYPFIHGDDLADPEFGEGVDPTDYRPPVQNLDAHVAPLGMEIYEGSQFPEVYAGRVFIAEHGSWNRSTKSGYRVVTVSLDETGRAVAYEPFAEGWLQGQDNTGRPVDLEHMPDGSLLLSDDQGGKVYRISFDG